MTALSIGDRVAALDADGRPVFSPVVAFLDRRPGGADKFFYSLSTADGNTLDLTPSHLIYAAPTNASIDADAEDGAAVFRRLVPVFARDVVVGQYVYVMNGVAGKGGKATPVRVTGVTTVHKSGAYAPMTATGSIVVNGVVASCYAIFENHWLTHVAMAPLRVVYALSASLGLGGGASAAAAAATAASQDGLHWYSTFLYNFADVFLPKDLYKSWFYDV